MCKRVFIPIIVAILAVAMPIHSVQAARAGSGWLALVSETDRRVGAPVAAALSADEIDGLLYMREEEKLARDVYKVMYSLWGVGSFQNIAGSEQMHMDRVLMLLNTYGIADPAQGPGVFTNTYLQELYDALITRGSQSITEAFLVGGAVEEIDILDLRTYLAQATHRDIQRAYNCLLNGSYNHLRVYAGAYTSESGEPYVAQYMTPEDVAAILSGSGCGGGRKGRRG